MNANLIGVDHGGFFYCQFGHTESCIFLNLLLDVILGSSQKLNCLKLGRQKYRHHSVRSETVRESYREPRRFQ